MLFCVVPNTYHLHTLLQTFLKNPVSSLFFPLYLNFNYIICNSNTIRQLIAKEDHYQATKAMPYSVREIRKQQTSTSRLSAILSRTSSLDPVSFLVFLYFETLSLCGLLKYKTGTFLMFLTSLFFIFPPLFSQCRS